MTARFCSQCGTELAASARFCTECGASQSKQPQQHQPALPKVQSGNKFSLPAVLLIVGVLLLTGGALVYFLDRLGGGPDNGQEAAAAPTAIVESDIPYPEVARISVEETKARADAGTAVILDVRSLEDYETLHVANAISIPLAELPDRFLELPQNAEILTYCT
jgi:hypothetical protein